MQTIYLDNNATTRPASKVVAAITEMLTEWWANPSSGHRPGQAARSKIELARASVARLIGIRDKHVLFTSGGTEANNLALRGVLEAPLEMAGKSPRPLLISTNVEHSSIAESTENLGQRGARVVTLPVDSNGLVDPTDLVSALNSGACKGRVTLVSIQWANNETGVMQPIRDLVAACRGHTEACGKCRVVFHTDAVQAVGKVAVDAAGSGIDLMSLSGHKFHGPKGAGALYVKPGTRLRRQMLGGHQERDRRGGTENVAAIVGLGIAADLASGFLRDARVVERQTALRNRFEQAMSTVLPDTVVHGSGAERIWNTSNLGFPGIEAEAVLLALSEKGLCASAGSACSSGSLEPSPVLLAMGIPEPVAHGSTRFSLSRDTGADQIDRAIQIVTEVVRRLGRTLPLGQSP
ncbi:MAG: cysteine desulfurase family protein [Vicinamibacterales bacterium]|jgi:cysteine desulfurase|nr:cysteine desulfurase family protein [Vicinamibacterales bacterium]